MAAGLYAHGMHMGNRCIKRDYVRAFQLYQEIGATSSMQSILRDLETRASTGSPRAKSHLRKLEKAGLIKKK
jgi:DNA-binding MarR family transcriptional regulator